MKNTSIHTAMPILGKAYLAVSLDKKYEVRSYGSDTAVCTRMGWSKIVMTPVN